MSTLALAALAIIGLAWLMQLMNTWKHGRSLSDVFLLTYGIGAALLLVDGAQTGFSTSTWLHLVTLLIVALVYIRVHRS
jgi:hypothetical protein